MNYVVESQSLHGYGSDGRGDTEVPGGAELGRKEGSNILRRLILCEARIAATKTRDTDGLSCRGNRLRE